MCVCVCVCVYVCVCNHSFGKMEDIVKVVCYNQRGYHLGTVEKFFIYKETIEENQLDDKTYFSAY